jgi:hypothetical protein
VLELVKIGLVVLETIRSDSPHHRNHENTIEMKSESDGIEICSILSGASDRFNQLKTGLKSLIYIQRY